MLVLAHCSAGSASTGAFDSGADAVVVPPDASVEDHAITDVKETTTHLTGTYFVVCLPALAGGNLAQSLRFKATVEYVEGTPSTLSTQLQPLPKGSVRVSEALSPIFPGAPISSPIKNGYFKWDGGATPDLPASNNALTGVTYGIDAFIIEGLTTNADDQFCAGFSGKSRPSGIEFKSDIDICLFQRVTSETSAMPVPSASAFTCPLPSPRPF